MRGEVESPEVHNRKPTRAKLNAVHPCDESWVDLNFVDLDEIMVPARTEGSLPAYLGAEINRFDLLLRPGGYERVLGKSLMYEASRMFEGGSICRCVSHESADCADRFGAPFWHSPR